MTARRLIAAALLALLAQVASPGMAGEPAIDARLEEALRAAGSRELLSVVVIFTEQVPPETVARLAREPDARRKIETRLRTLAKGRRLALDKTGDGVARVRPLWIVNAVALEAAPDVVRALAARPDVARVRLVARGDAFLSGRRGTNDGSTGLAPQPDGGHGAAIHGIAKAPPGGSAGVERPSGRGRALPGRAPGIVLPPERRDWGAVRTGAFRAHRELGLVGDGVVVAVVDSGACWRHPGLAGRVWVNPGEDLDGDGEVMDPDDANGLDDDGNGFVDDLIGWDIDDSDNDPDDIASGHGSHVAGTVAGDGGGGFAAGSAPGASVMIVRVGRFSSDEVDAWRGIEYALANGADVINLSMGWPHVWLPERATWRRLVDTVTAMGVPFVVSAGNEGWAAPPDSVRTPADVPSAIAVGSTDRGDAISDESSIGPVTWQDVPEYGDYPLPAGKLKPELTAPGVEIESHDRCDGTTFDTGTSMAAPHVAGAIALLLEADLTLTPEGVLEILAETSVDLGAPGPDPVFGYGRIDAFAAASRANRGLRQDGVRVEDGALGNGSGALDPGETARLVVALGNDDARRGVAGLDARLVSETPGLVVIEDTARYGAIPPGGSAEPAAGGFVVRSDLPCAAGMRLRLDLTHADGGTSRTRVELRSGRETPARLVRETFESDGGWTSGGDATAGAWQRAVPDGARLGRTLTSPRRDTADRGRLAFVTGAGRGSEGGGSEGGESAGGGSAVGGAAVGSSARHGGRTARDSDVDGGEARLTSPAFDASDFTRLAVSYARWFFSETPLEGNVPGVDPATSRDGDVHAAGSETPNVVAEPVAGSEVPREANMPAADSETPRAGNVPGVDSGAPRAGQVHAAGSESLRAGDERDASAEAERLVVEASDDDGESWVPIDELTAGQGGWERVQRPLGPYVALTGALRLRVRAIDPADEGPDGVVEAALDDLRLDGLRLVCDPLR